MPGNLFANYILTEGINATAEWRASISDSTAFAAFREDVWERGSWFPATRQCGRGSTCGQRTSRPAGWSPRRRSSATPTARPAMAPQRLQEPWATSAVTHCPAASGIAAAGNLPIKAQENTSAAGTSTMVDCFCTAESCRGGEAQ